MANRWALTMAALLLASTPALAQSAPNAVATPQYQSGQVQYYAVPAQPQPQPMYVQPQMQQQLPNGAVVLVPVGRLSNGQVAYVIQQAQQPTVQYVPVYIMPQSTAQPAQPQAQPAQPAAPAAAPASSDASATTTKHPVAQGVLNGLVNMGGALPGYGAGVTATQPLLNLLLQKL